MWFNNAIMFRFEHNQTSDLRTALAEHLLKPCPPHARFIYGWTPAFSEELVHEIAGTSLICMGKEERILPRSVLNKLLAEKIQVIETQQARSVKRVEKAQMAEDLEFELLPKSFCVQKKLNAILDHVNNRLIINTSSRNQAAQLTSLLRKSLAGLNIEPLHTEEQLALVFAHWLHAPESLPQGFQLASDCLLFALDDEKKRIQCRGYELPAEEIVRLLAQGMATAEIALTWKERIQFTLTQDFSLKKIKSLEYLVDEFADINKLDDAAQQQDAALSLLAGELRQLISDLSQCWAKAQPRQAEEYATLEEIAK